MFKKNPIDTDPYNPMSQKPYWAWMHERQGGSSKFHESLLEYTGLDKVPVEERRGSFEEEELKVYKHTHQHFWFLKLRGLPTDPISKETANG